MTAREGGTALRTVVWSARTGVLALVGLLALSNLPHDAGAVVTQLAAFALCTATLAAWMLLGPDPAARPRPARRLPWVYGAMAAAGAVATTSGGAGGAFVAFVAIAVLAAGSDLDFGGALAVAGAAVLALELGGIAFNAGYDSLIGDMLLVGAALLIGRNRAAYRIRAEQSAALLEQYQRLQEERRRADVLDERARIAREIHDVLAHSLGALGIQIQLARAMLTDLGDVDRAVDTLLTAQRMAAEGLVETRRAVHALRTDTLPLDEELARLAAAHQQRHGAAVEYQTHGARVPLPPDATVALLRTAQEALVNATKHAPGQRMEMRLEYQRGTVLLSVENALAARSQARDAEASEAAGPPEETRPNGTMRATGTRPPVFTTVDGGYGLTGMRERLRLLNGTLAAGEEDGTWRVVAALPLSHVPGEDGDDAECEHGPGDEDGDRHRHEQKHEYSNTLFRVRPEHATTPQTESAHR